MSRAWLLMRQYDRHLNMTAGSHDLERYFITVAANPQIDAGRPELQIAQQHFVEEFRQPWITQTDLAARSIEFEAERRFQQRERRRAGPCLRCAGDGIEHRPTPPLALETAEQFRQPPQIHVARGVEQALEQMRHRMLQAVAREAERDQRIVVRPD